MDNHNKKKKGKKPKNKEQDYDEDFLTKQAENNLHDSTNENKDDNDDEVLDVNTGKLRKIEDINKEQAEIRRKKKEKKPKQKKVEDDLKQQKNDSNQTKKESDGHYNLYNFCDKFGYLTNKPLFYLLESNCPYNKYTNALSIDNLFEMFENGKINKKTMKVKLIDLFTYDKKYEFFPISKITKCDWIDRVEYSNIFNERKINVMIDDFMLNDFNEISSLPVKEKKEKLSELLNSIYKQFINK